MNNRPLDSRTHRRSTGAILALGILFGAGLTLAVSRAEAQYPVSSQDGRPLPEDALEFIRKNPDFYTFKHAWQEKATAARNNRRRLERGGLVPQATPEELYAMTTVTGTFYIPVLLGKYKNTGADPYPASDLQQELFDGPWPTGTMSEYYSEVSYGNITVTGTVFDWVTVPESDDYYANGRSGLPTEMAPIARTPEFIVELLAANDAAVDFGLFDNDGPDGMPNSGDDDGKVDFIAVVHPEIGAECSGNRISDDIWAHRSSLSQWAALSPFGSEWATNDPAAIGGVITVDDYVIQPALACSLGMIEIGVFCHEFGHAFGIPDLYDPCPANGGSAGIGHWGLMASGNWNTPERPAHMSAWTKAELGWLTPSVVATDLLGWTIPSASVSPTAFKLWSDGDPGDEYFLVEYRTRDGFDDQLWAEGILIWHVDDGVRGSPLSPCSRWNNDETHKTIDLECADQSGSDHTTNADNLDGGVGLNRGDAGDPFCDGDAFDPGTNPSSVAYNGVGTKVQVASIVGCGNPQGVVADLVVGNPSPGVNLCIQDCGSDACVEPAPCDVFWASPAIYIDNDGDGVIDPPAEGLENRLFAVVHNVGTAGTNNVSVDFYYADPTMGLRFPSTGTLIDSDNLGIMAAESSLLTEVRWNIPVPPPNVDHYCVGVIAQNAADPQTSERAEDDNNLAQVNIHALYAKAGTAVPPSAPGAPPQTQIPMTTFTAVRDIQVCNPATDGQDAFCEIVIGSPPLYDDAVIPAGWTINLSFTQIVLPPGECQTLQVTALKTDAVHLDAAIVPLTLLCDQVPVGGNLLEFHIDNVPPPPPCALTATHELSGTDYFPGDEVTHLQWGDSFVDALGFPERVERWRVYAVESSTTPIDPAYLVTETCLDYDPATLERDLFLPAVVPPERPWYKVVAVDRAGNESTPCTAQLIEGGTVSVSPDDPGPSFSAGVFPNPVVSSARIRYSVPEEGDVALQIFDLQGSLVRELVRGRRPGGEHELVWDGRDYAEQPVAGGLYLYRLVHNGNLRTGRIAVLR